MVCVWQVTGMTPLGGNKCVIFLYKHITQIAFVLHVLNSAVMLNSISVHKVILLKLLLKAGFVQAHSSNPVTYARDEPMS